MLVKCVSSVVLLLSLRMHSPVARAARALAGRYTVASKRAARRAKGFFVARLDKRIKDPPACESRRLCFI